MKSNNAQPNPKRSQSATERKAAQIIIDKELLRQSGSHFRLVLTCIGLAILIVAVMLLIIHSFNKSAKIGSITSSLVSQLD